MYKMLCLLITGKNAQVSYIFTSIINFMQKHKNEVVAILMASHVSAIVSHAMLDARYDTLIYQLLVASKRLNSSEPVNS